MKKYVAFIILCFSLLVGCAYSKSFSFTPKEPQWEFYGEGSGSYVTNLTHTKEGGSLWISTDWGETETAHFTWKDLSPGLYKVITYVRAQDVQKGAEGVSFWHFYDGGYGTKSVFNDLYGSYDWRKIEYTVNVKANDLTIWFRLKSPGQIWVDDFFIEKIETEKTLVNIEPPTPLLTKLVTKEVPKKAERKKLYNFDSNESGQPFSRKNNTGVFAAQKFYNFLIKSMPVKDWSNFDHLEIEIFNPNSTYTDLFVTLADDKSTDYWSQVNYKQTLAPGWNKLNLSLTQFVGERGSHRFQRSINLSKLQKFFVVIDPDSKSTFSSKSFLIDNIYLSSNPMPSVPEGVMAFDFTSQKAEKIGNLTRITTQTSYDNQRGYGFVDPKFWRVEDSQYVSETLRFTIGLLSGHFKIQLPNGTYQLSLVIDKLGFWDVPFWSNRMVYVNGTPIYKETRDSEKSFLGDLLRFEGVVPDINDNPYDLYLSKVFHSIDKTVVIKNGFLDLEFNGDASGISLNSLILWNKNNEASALQYKQAFEKRNREEFNWMSHSVQPKVTGSTQKLSISVVKPDLYLNAENIKPASAKSLNFIGGAGDMPYQLVQLNSGANDAKISWTFNDFTSDKGEKIKAKELLISDLIFQYTSPDINHETFLITGKYLKPMLDHSLVLKKNRNRYLWMQFHLNEKMPQGRFFGEVVFHCGEEQIKLPVEIDKLSYKLPKIEFPVGFFGIDPLPYSYFPGKGYNQLRKKYRYMALDAIGEAGFTTFTGLPEDTGDLEELFEHSSKWGIETVYSYGGQFPQAFLDLSKKGDLSEEKYLEKVSFDLKPLLTRKDWPKIVHTFSDEAAGYSDKVSSDIEFAKKLKRYLPFMALGGFGTFNGGDTAKLNAYFDFGFYSSLDKKQITKIKENNQRWGFYNGSAGNLDDPRFSFGLGLYISRLNGLSQYLEWHLSAVNNYPYYDFDGRESDVVMFFPTSDGRLLPSLRYEMAVQGLHSYKKLKLLESAISNNSGSLASLTLAKVWMNKIRKENYFFATPNFISNKNVNFYEFELQLNEHLKNIFLKK